MIGCGIGVGVARPRGLAGAIRALFNASEKGVWYDPSDFSTLFQDSAGITPVTAVGDPVGLVLDKSQGATRTDIVPDYEFVSGASGFVSSETYTTSMSVSSGVMTLTATGVNGRAVLQFSAVAGRSYLATVRVRYVSGTGKAKAQFSTASSGADSGATLIGTTNSSSFVTLALTFSPASSATMWLTVGESTAITGSVIEVDSFRCVEIPGFHATQATSTARPILQQDASGHYYLQFDGVDDFLVTPSIDFSGTDKMSVFAGVRKLSDAARAVVFTSNGTGVNSFFLEAPSSTLNNYLFGVVGTTVGRSVQYAISAPVTSVISGVSDALTSTVLRVDGVQRATSIAAMSGPFANVPLYVGSRSVSDLPFNGHLYSLIVRGALSDASQITAAESYVNSRTGAY